MPALFAALPVTFVENRGQWDHEARFVARLGPMTAFLEQRGFAFTLEAAGRGRSHPSPTSPAGSREPTDRTVRGVAVRMHFEGARG